MAGTSWICQQICLASATAKLIKKWLQKVYNFSSLLFNFENFKIPTKFISTWPCVFFKFINNIFLTEHDETAAKKIHCRLKMFLVDLCFVCQFKGALKCIIKVYIFSKCIYWYIVQYGCLFICLFVCLLHSFVNLSWCSGSYQADVDLWCYWLWPLDFSWVLIYWPQKDWELLEDGAWINKQIIKKKQTNKRQNYCHHKWRVHFCK